MDPRHACARTAPAGTRIIDYGFTTESEIARSEFYQDYLAQNDWGYVGAVMLKNDAQSFAGIAIQRPRRQGSFELHDLDLLDRLAPHLLRALRLQTRFAEFEAQRWADQTLRDRLPFAVILVDEQGRIVGQNQAATDLLAAGDGLTARCGRLRAAHPTEQAVLDQLLRAAAPAVNATGTAAGGAIVLRRPSERRSLSVLVMPVPRRRNAFSLGLGAPIPAALVIVTDPERLPRVPAALVQRLYGLTPAEAALAQALAAGKSLQEHADEGRLTFETARWRLKQVLAKTDTHRQAELVRLLLASAVLGERPAPQTGGAAPSSDPHHR